MYFWGLINGGLLAGLYGININVLGKLTATDEELLQECPKFLMEVLEMVINYPFYNIKMPNVIIPEKMIAGFVSELNRTVTRNPEIKNSLGVSLVSTLQSVKNVSFSNLQSKERMWDEMLKLMSQEKHVEPFTEFAKTFRKYNENVVNSF